MRLGKLSIKNVKSFRGHEGEECLQGSLYFDGKRVGYWSDNSWGGCMDFDLDRETEKMLNAYAKEVLALNPKGFVSKEYDLSSLYQGNELEGLMTDLTALWTYEKQWKAGNKKGYPVLMVVKKNKNYYEELVNCKDSYVEKAKKEYPIIIGIYRSTEDFNIDVETGASAVS